MPNKRRTYTVDAVGYPVAYSGLGNSYASTYPLTYSNVNTEYIENPLPSVCRSIAVKPEIYPNYYSPTVLTSARPISPVSSMSTALATPNTVSVGGGYKVMNA